MIHAVALMKNELQRFIAHFLRISHKIMKKMRYCPYFVVCVSEKKNYETCRRVSETID